MKEVVKVTLILALFASLIGAVINEIDNPRPTKLATTISREINKGMK